MARVFIAVLTLQFRHKTVRVPKPQHIFIVVRRKFDSQLLELFRHDATVETRDLEANVVHGRSRSWGLNLKGQLGFRDSEPDTLGLLAASYFLAEEFPVVA